jgi:hypothetical protein
MLNPAAEVDRKERYISTPQAENCLQHTGICKIFKMLYAKQFQPHFNPLHFAKSQKVWQPKTL